MRVSVIMKTAVLSQQGSAWQNSKKQFISSCYNKSMSTAIISFRDSISSPLWDWIAMAKV